MTAPGHRVAAELAVIDERPPASLLSVAGLRMAVEALGDRLHAAGDAEARAWGWEVTRTPWGGRSYRDPRLSRLSEAGAGGATRRAVAGRRRSA